MKSQKKKIFVSYSVEDRGFVGKLVKDLRTHGVEVWEYSEGIKVGESIASKIELELSNADYYTIILSPNSVASKWVQRELHSAIDIENRRGGSVFIVPVLLAKCDVPLFIRTQRYANFIENYQLGLNELLNALGVLDTRSRKILSDQQKVKAKAFAEKIDACIATDISNLLNAAIPNLLKDLSESLAESITEIVVRPTLMKWKQREIATLNDMESVMKSSCASWAESPEIKKLISSETQLWLIRIKDTIDNITDPICVEFGVPVHIIGNRILNTPVTIKKFEKLEFSANPYPIEIGLYVATITYAAITTLVTEIMAVSIWGLIIGWLVANAIMIFTGLKSEDLVKRWNMPKALRNPLLSESKTEEICTSSKNSFRTKIFGELNNEEFKWNLSKSILEFISNSIKQEVENLILFIP